METNEKFTDKPVADEPSWRYKLRSSKIGTLALIVVSLLVVLVVAALFNNPKGSTTTDAGKVGQIEVSNEATQLEVGQQAPDFTITTVDGNNFRLSEHKGEPVWVIFQATWCPGCQSEASDIQDAYEAAKGSGLNVIAVYSGEDKDAVAAFANRMGLTFFQASDQEASLSGAWGVTGMPVHFFIDPDGRLNAIHAGVMTRSQIDEQLAAIR